MREGEASSFGPEEMGFQDEQKRDEKAEREKGVLERLRTSRAIRPIILALGLGIGASGGMHAYQQSQERARIEQEGARIEEKVERAERLFGEYGKIDAAVTEKEHATETEPLITETSDILLYGHTKLIKVDAKEFKEFLSTTYPKGWVDNEVSSITQSDERKPLGEKYGGAKHATVAAAYIREGERGKIKFYDVTLTNSPSHLLRDVLPHELGHGNDWLSDQEMTYEERLDLQLAVAERLSADDRFQSSYVESIQNDNPQAERCLKALEYWAEICGQYFNDPSKLHYNDYELVNNCVKAGDPDYDENAANEVRNNFLESLDNQDRHP